MSSSAVSFAASSSDEDDDSMTDGNAWSSSFFDRGFREDGVGVIGKDEGVKSFKKGRGLDCGDRRFGSEFPTVLARRRVVLSAPDLSSSGGVAR